MKREVWPENYRMPGWLGNLLKGVPTILPSIAFNQWLGCFWLATAFLFISMQIEGVNEARIIAGLCFAACAVGCLRTYPGKSDVTVDQLFERWIDAKAETLAASWSGDELEEMQSNLKWRNNHAMNVSAESNGNRSSNNPALSIGLDTKFLSRVIHHAEAFQKDNLQRQAKRISGQFDASVEQSKVADFGKDIWLARKEQLSATIRWLDDEFYEWRDLTKELKQAASRCVEKATSQALSVPEQDRLKEWKSSFNIHWSNALKLAHEVQEAISEKVKVDSRGGTIALEYIHHDWSKDAEGIVPDVVKKSVNHGSDERRAIARVDAAQKALSRYLTE